MGGPVTPFALLASLAGLSREEAGELVGFPLDTVKSWAAGRRPARPEALAALRGLIAAQERGAAEALAEIARVIAAQGAPDRIDIGFPSDDHEAQTLGFPSVGAWGAMAARVLARSPIPIRLVPRGATLASAAAADARDRL